MTPSPPFFSGGTLLEWILVVGNRWWRQGSKYECGFPVVVIIAMCNGYILALVIYTDYVQIVQYKISCTKGGVP